MPVKPLRQNIVKRISALMDERGIQHLVNYTHGGEAPSIAFWITDDHGGVEEGKITSETLISELEWLDLPLI